METIIFFFKNNGKKHKELEKILDTPIDKSLIKEIEIGRGETASYIPIKNILDLANKVFGFSNWSVEYLDRTIETVQVEVRDKTPVDYVIITQHVRVSVQIQDETEEEDCTIHSGGWFRNFSEAIFYSQRSRWTCF